MMKMVHREGEQEDVQMQEYFCRCCPMSIPYGDFDVTNVHEIPTGVPFDNQQGLAAWMSPRIEPTRPVAGSHISLHPFSRIELRDYTVESVDTRSVDVNLS